MFFLLQQFCNSSTRELNRLGSVTRSLVFQEFGQSLNGLSSIRSCHEQQKTFSKLVVAIIRHIKTYFAMMSANRSVALRLEVLVGLLVPITAVFCLSVWEFIGAGLAGLALIYALLMTSMLNIATRLWPMASNRSTRRRS